MDTESIEANFDPILDNNNQSDARSLNGIDLSYKSSKESLFENFVLHAALPRCQPEKTIKIRCLLLSEESPFEDKPSCVIYEREANNLYKMNEKRRALDWNSLTPSQRQAIDSLFSPVKEEMDSPFEEQGKIEEGSSRRKRKIGRPTKIPQDGDSTENETLDLTNEKKSPKLADSPESKPDITNNLVAGLDATKLLNPFGNLVQTDLSSLFLNQANLNTILRQNLAVNASSGVGLAPMMPTVFPGQKTNQPLVPSALDLSQFQQFVTINTQLNGPRGPITSTANILNGASTNPRPIRPRVPAQTPAISNEVRQALANRPKQKPRNFDDPSQARRYAKSFDCNQCKQVFSSLSALCEHTFAIHKAFRCMICEAQFTQRSNLQRHSLRHVGFKPFICNICGKAYYRKDHLVRHIELSHPGTNPKQNITVKLSSADCLQYLEKNPPSDPLAVPKLDDEDAALLSFKEDDSMEEDDSKAESIYDNPGQESDLMKQEELPPLPPAPQVEAVTPREESPGLAPLSEDLPIPTS
ncbi:hypothetical protein Ciccas_005621 [Cichlidogyrus casuarinus]|uniref:C2H2-type domain-containing protein n=1 Tax=Cichlidogyrus casuarinus TaxID=1844966 RepID=A0ABD2Q850_9PLAT